MLSGVLLFHQHATAQKATKDAARTGAKATSTAHAGVLEVRVQLRFLPSVIRHIIIKVLRIYNFQGIRIDGFGRQSRACCRGNGGNKPNVPAAQTQSRPHLRQPPQNFSGPSPPSPGL